MKGPDIVVIGASAGGVEALMTIVRDFPADLSAAVLIVLHVPAHGTSVLPQLLSRAGNLVAKHPVDAESVRHGRIYVAPPDHHMILRDGVVEVVLGPRENGHRPAIDPLFRSAARVYGERVIGVVLSGASDDATAGLLAIRARGGLTIVQDPDDAAYPSMPKSALQYVRPDHIAKAHEIGALIARLVSERSASRATAVPLAHADDPDPAIDRPSLLATPEAYADTQPSSFACPECHGVLWEVKEGELTRYRCRVGHAYLPESLSDAVEDRLEEALWIALRSLRESSSLATRLAERAAVQHLPLSAEKYRERSREAAERATLIESVLRRGQLLDEVTPATTKTK
ncbi:MAG TPA: chemotaxis protein CheB, partial [Polyangiales bacterium]|nr:chemotaxis protein CheB [Polyangiales bacterium]